MLTPEELRAVQLEVLDRFLVWCAANDLRCMAAYGTLLGAVRHEGFIPWDDDVDLMMPRGDYERLRDHARVDGLVVGGHRSDASWPYTNVKVCDTRTVVTGETPYPTSIGVNVDVFPVDPVPSGGARRLQSVGITCLKVLAAAQTLQPRPGRSWVNRVLAGVAVPVARVVPRRWVLRALDRLAQWASDGQRAGVLVGSYQWTVPAGKLRESTFLKFEGRELPAPSGATAVLTSKYGPDHMTPPPPAARVTHHTFTALWA